MKGHNYGLCRKCGKTHTHPRSMLGRQHSEETKLLYSQQRKGKPKTEIWKKRIGDANRGKKRSKEVCLIYSENQKKLMAIPERRKHFSEIRKGKTFEEIVDLEKATGWKRNIGLGTTKSWDSKSQEEKEEYGKKMSELVTAIWRDPNSTFNSEEFRKNRNRTGYGTVQYSSDGHLCFSNLELIFDEWLVSHKIEHYPQPRIPNIGKHADQLVNGHYIEVDGMNRNREYWDVRYNGSDIKPIILKVGYLVSIYDLLNEDLLQKLRSSG